MKLRAINPGTLFKATTTLKVLDPVGRVKAFVDANPGWILVQNIEDDSVFLMKSDTDVEIVE